MRKQGSPREIPPPLELECLRVLWQIGQGTVREVRCVLIETRPLAYTTVMTLLDRLVRKGFVSRQKFGRSFAYAPVLGREAVRRAAVRELVRSLFDNSSASLTAYLASEPEVLEIETPVVVAAAAVASAGTATDSHLDTALL